MQIKYIKKYIYIQIYPQLLAPQYLNCILFNFFQITSSIRTILGPKVIKQIRNLKINTIQQKIYYKLKQLTRVSKILAPFFMFNILHCFKQ